MPELKIRVQLQELVTHSFLIDLLTDDQEAIADAAEQIFVHSEASELEEYSCSFENRHFVGFKPPAFDNTQAQDEGWGLLNGDEIQKDDDANVFEDDDLALRFVKYRASRGSAYHEQAMRIVGLAADD